MERVQRAQGWRRLGLGLTAAALVLAASGGAGAADFRGDRDLLDMRRAVWLEGEVAAGHYRDEREFGRLSAAVRLAVVEHVAARLEATALRQWLSGFGEPLDRWLIGRGWAGLEGFADVRLGPDARVRYGVLAEVGTPYLEQVEGSEYLEREWGWHYGWARRVTAGARLEGQRNWLQLQVGHVGYLGETEREDRDAGWPDPHVRTTLAFAIALDERHSLGADLTVIDAADELSLGTTYSHRQGAGGSWGIRLAYAEDFVIIGLVARHDPGF